MKHGDKYNLVYDGVVVGQGVIHDLDLPTIINVCGYEFEKPNPEQYPITFKLGDGEVGVYHDLPSLCAAIHKTVTTNKNK